ncbi:MAG: hypothetical protein C3F13_04035 [Anaerolineales bacterium]|nr:MAG: hypothetical protein C3F13_04035 [Anaerolineales bacterium]
MIKALLRILVLGCTILLVFTTSQPVLGVMENHTNQAGLSGAIYTFHGDMQVGNQLSENTCLYCHPNPQSAVTRDVMRMMDICCTSCHGRMTEFGDFTRVFFASPPSCSYCHNQMAVTTDVVGSAAQIFLDESDPVSLADLL